MVMQISPYRLVSRMSFEVIILKGGARVIVDWSQKSICKKCRMDIVWANSNKTGKYIPIAKDADGSWISHFANCRYAAEFRNIRTPGAGDLLTEEIKQRKRERWLENGKNNMA